MERTQISLTSEQAARLRRIAARRGTSMAALIRDAVDRVLPTDNDDLDTRWERALRAVDAAGRGGARDVSVKHDEYLAEAILDKRR